MKAFWAALLVVGALTGCGGVISKEVRREAVPIRGFTEVREAPDSFKGKTVILGGNIIETRNQPDNTVLVVLDMPLAAGDEPRNLDTSEGRFMVRAQGYLDPAIYAPGRRLTVAGTVEGVQTEPVGQIDYRYVVLKARELYLWGQNGQYSPSGHPFYWSPWWYDPFWRPWPWWYEP